MGYMLKKKILYGNFLKYLPIHDASVDLSESMIPSSINWGIRIAENPNTVPILRLAIPLTIPAAIY